MQHQSALGQTPSDARRRAAAAVLANPIADKPDDRMEPAEAAALLAAELRRSLGSSPQLDKALGQLFNLLA